MALQQAQVDDVMKIAKDMLDNVDPAVKKLSAIELQELDEVMRKHISQEIQLTSSLGDISGIDDKEMVDRMKTLLSDEDFKTAAGYVDQETYTMDIQGSQATILRGGQKFLEPIQLNSLEGVNEFDIIQIASLVIESVLFILGVIGIKIPIKNSLLKKIIPAVSPTLKQPAFKRAVKAFLRAWKSGGPVAKAQAIYKLIKKCNDFGIFWKIVKMSLAEMKWYDYAKAIAEVTATIVATFATGGAGLIGKIALSVGDALNITKKVINLLKNEEMAQAF